ncbi:protein of unknown function [Lactiplantibacillus plantarum]|jgi:hypothetical protein
MAIILPPTKKRLPTHTSLAVTAHGLLLKRSGKQTAGTNQHLQLSNSSFIIDIKASADDSSFALAFFIKI